MDIRRVISDNMPLLLTSMAVTGVVSTAVLAVRATPEAIREIWDAESEHDRKITNLEKARLTWRHYVPAAFVGGVTITAMIGVHSVSTKRQAAIAGLYSLTERAYSEYRNRVIEEIGEKKDKAIRDDIQKSRIENNPVSSSSEIIITGAGDHLCYDSITGRYFESNIEKIKSAQNEINAKCINEMYASQNDFYRMIDLPITPFGEEIGWRTDHMMDISFSSHLEPETKRPCLSLDYRLDPIRGYYKAY